MKVAFWNTAYSMLIQRALNIYDRQRTAIAQNISQVNNPDYSRVDTDFTKELQQAIAKARLRTTHSKHIAEPRFPQSDIVKNEHTKEPVDLTREMTDLAENQIRTDFALRSLRQYWDLLRMGITGRV